MVVGTVQSGFKGNGFHAAILLKQLITKSKLLTVSGSPIWASIVPIVSAKSELLEYLQSYAEMPSCGQPTAALSWKPCMTSIGTIVTHVQRLMHEEF